MSDKNVTLYALSTCIHCKKTKEYLDDCGVKYDCIYVDKLTGDDRKQIIEVIKKVNPKLSFPTLLVDEDAIVGFKQDQIKDALEKE